MKPKILLKAEPVYIASQEFLNRSMAKSEAPKQPQTGSHPEPQAPILKDMTSCVDLLHSSFHSVNVDLSEFLRDNQYFRVIAVVGRGQPKTLVLDQLLDKNPGVFPRDSKGVQMFITKDRHILLSVELSNFQKLGRDGDLELLMLYISLLKICHSLIIVEPEMDARNCIRLLSCAELMDFGYEKLGLNMEFLPNIIFMPYGWTNTTSSLVQCLFKGSRLQDNVQVVDKSHSDSTMLQHLTKLAYRNPRATISMQTTPPFTELNWYQIVQNLWKLHKSNYFLLKYVKGSSFQ